MLRAECTVSAGEVKMGYNQGRLLEEVTSHRALMASEESGFK